MFGVAILLGLIIRWATHETNRFRAISSACNSIVIFHILKILVQSGRSYDQPHTVQSHSMYLHHKSQRRL